jgi:large subunit ribosomal protein L14
MIQVGTILSVIDNSGAREVRCIKVVPSSKRRYAYIGDLIMISVKSLRTRRKSTSKTRKGELYKALVVRTKCGSKKFSGEGIKFFENSVVLFNKQNKLIGTRILGSLPVHFRYTKFLRILSIANGSIF